MQWEEKRNVFQITNVHYSSVGLSDWTSWTVLEFPKWSRVDLFFQFVLCTDWGIHINCTLTIWKITDGVLESVKNSNKITYFSTGQLKFVPKSKRSKILFNLDSRTVDVFVVINSGSNVQCPSLRVRCFLSILHCWTMRRIILLVCFLMWINKSNLHTLWIVYINILRVLVRCNVIFR